MSGPAKAGTAHAQRVVISGVGAVSAAGHGALSLSDALAEGRPRLSEIERFVPGAGEPTLAGQVTDFVARDWLPTMLVRQTDRSTHMAFAATRLGLEEAKLDLDSCDSLRCGVMTGIGVGGMVFAEPELYNQRVFGPDEVSTYQSIAWFYAAAMGQLSISLDLRGYSKTFVADRVGSLHALGHAYHAIREGRLDVCLAGGTEAPLAPFIYRSLASTGWLGQERYLPFSTEGSGFLLGEGAVILVVESLAHALARDAPIICEISGFGMATDCRAKDYEAPAERVIARSMRLALGGSSQDAPLEQDASRPGSAEVSSGPGQGNGTGGTATGHDRKAQGRSGSLADDRSLAGRVDLVVADGAATPEADGREVRALESTLAERWDALDVTAPKAVVGELYGAGGALQVAAAALAIREKKVWPLATQGEAVSVPHSKQTRERAIDTALVHSAGIRGLSASLSVRRFHSST